MKRITLPLFVLLLCTHSYAQDPIFNISQQSNWNPDTVPQYNDIWGYSDCQENEYAIIGSSQKVHFVNVTDPTAPAEVASFAGGESTVWRDIKTYRGHAYSVSDNTTEGLLIFNLYNLPFSVEQVYQSNVDFNSAQNIFIDEAYGRLYVVGSEVNDLLIFDLVADPANPTLIASTNLPGGYIRDIYVRDNMAYCSHLSNGLYIYDCSDAMNISIVGMLENYPGQVMNSSNWLSDDGNTLIFSDETPGAQLKLLDVSDPSVLDVQANHVFHSNLLGPGNNSLAHKPIIHGDYAFISYYHDGVQVFDISDPDNITRVAYYDTHPSNLNYDGIQGNWGIFPFLPSGNIIASDINNGLFVMSMDSIELDPMVNENLVEAYVELSNSPIICAGDSVMLTAVENDAYTYIWRKNGQLLDSESHQLSAKETGEYQLEVNNGICSDLSEVFQVEFNVAPDLSTLIGDIADICYGTSYPIMAPTGFDYYIWLKNGNAMPNTNNLLMVVQSGTYSLIAYSNGCATTSNEYEINVIDIPNPEITAIETTICNNEEALLEATSGAENYIWFYNSLIVSETSEPFFAATQSGNYHVELQIGDCSEVSEEIEITVLQAPNNTIGINGPTSFCPGQTVTLNAAQSADIVDWSWLLDNVEIGTEPNIEVGSTGTYELVVTSTNSCTAINSIELEVIELEVPEISFEGTGLLSTAADSYQWYFNGELISGATEQFFQPENNGTYQVEITGNGCTLISSLLTYQVTNVSTPESLQDLSVYPNPVMDFVQFDLDTKTNGSLQVRLVNLNGQVLQSLELSESTTFSERLDVAALPVGVYFMQLSNADGSVSKKIVKQ